MTVQVDPLPASQVVATLATSMQSLVLDALSQGGIASSLAALGTLAQVCAAFLGMSLCYETIYAWAFPCIRDF
jgi:hypothetical protein